MRFAKGTTYNNNGDGVEFSGRENERVTVAASSIDERDIRPWKSRQHGGTGGVRRVYSERSPLEGETRGVTERSRMYNEQRGSKPVVAERGAPVIPRARIASDGSRNSRGGGRPKREEETSMASERGARAR